MQSRNKSENYDDIRSGQTLFDFLKRKKKFALEKSLSRSRRDPDKQNLANNVVSQSKKKENQGKQSCSPKNKYEQTYRETARSNIGNIRMGNEETSRTGLYNTQLLANAANATPKRVSFAQTKQKNGGFKSSFIELISPLKRRNNKTPPEVESIKQSAQKIVTVKGQGQGQGQGSNHNIIKDQFHRKRLNMCLGELQQTFQKFITISSSIKQKSHLLFIELKPILRNVEQSNNPNFSRRAQEAKLKLRSFQHLFKELNLENCPRMLAEIHANFNEHLAWLESSFRNSIESDMIQVRNAKSQNKDIQIADLKKSNEKLQKEIDLLQRKIQKLQKQKQKAKWNSQSSLQKGEKTFQARVDELSLKNEAYQQKIHQLSKQLENSKESQRSLQKSLKDLNYLKQEAEKRYIEENINVKNEKEHFLLNEINMLKKEFRADMEQLTSLYNAKQTENLQLISELKLQNSELSKKIHCQKEVGTKIVSEAVNNRQEVEKIRRKNQCLVTDLHRMNQELYQHWLGLKDIKTLVVRLHIFNKFSKIYQDICFNDQLFI